MLTNRTKIKINAAKVGGIGVATVGDADAAGITTDQINTFSNSRDSTNRWDLRIVDSRLLDSSKR